MIKIAYKFEMPLTQIPTRGLKQGIICDHGLIVWRQAVVDVIIVVVVVVVDVVIVVNSGR